MLKENMGSHYHLTVKEIEVQNSLSQMKKHVRSLFLILHLAL